MYFEDYLKSYGINPNEYLNIAQNNAKLYKLNYRHLRFSDRKDKKLMILNPSTNKWVYFGASSYKDYIIYRLLNNPQADEHRRRYIMRASQIRGNWIYDIYSSNQLAINILW